MRFLCNLLLLIVKVGFQFSFELIARVSQKTAFFHMGYLVESGKTKNIFTSPKDERTQNYITGTPLLSDKSLTGATPGSASS